MVIIYYGFIEFIHKFKTCSFGQLYTHTKRSVHLVKRKNLNLYACIYTKYMHICYQNLQNCIGYMIFYFELKSNNFWKQVKQCSDNYQISIKILVKRCVESGNTPNKHGS